MQYLIMFLIVVGLSLSDILTGLIKASAASDYHSGTMREGMYRKVSEWLIMLTSIGLEIGLKMLGEYYQSEQLANFAGTVTAISIFVYISGKINTVFTRKRTCSTKSCGIIMITRNNNNSSIAIIG